MTVHSVSSAGPLHGLRVVEMGQLIAGPFCGQLLGDLGADVIKIEPPGAGDPMRRWGRGDPPVWWEVIARNKRSVSIDLRRPEGQELARRLIMTADVLIENFRPGTLEKWDLAPEKLRTGNPRLIVARLSGYGQDGPYAQRTGFGLVGEAMGGLRHIVGSPDRPPSRVGISIGDSLCGTYTALGILAAVTERQCSGRGQVIDSSLYESVLQVMESLVADYSVHGIVRERSGAILPGIAPSNGYPCRDGQYLIGANQDAVFARLCAAMDQPELARDPRFGDHVARGRHQAELDELISAWTRGHTVGEIDELMVSHRVPGGRSYTAREMVSDPHFAARQSIVTLDHPKLGPIMMQNVAPRFSRTPAVVRRLAPAHPGEHNQEILGELLRLPDDRIAALQETGVI
ncbi:CaiB/BaiF CoA transferase family protein [Amycolatopsis pithecellobii]|uniref:CoA transferase n=1 Tax=Amycolatopsis pithecellobii TaxID=664692 RepID=A0A6N7YNK0_9PSEU|nr:CoA transferase [Amycolatopsis pithecellobii]MTD54577.1 CoA transferase [Amycolatopsis pithecellobii]